MLWPEEQFLYYFSLLFFFSAPFLFSLNWDSWRGCDLCWVFYEPEGNNNGSDNNNNKEPVVGLFAIKRVMSQMQIAHPVHCFMIPRPLHSKIKSTIENENQIIFSNSKRCVSYK